VLSAPACRQQFNSIEHLRLSVIRP
jgi:hypothetical protein